VYSVENHAKWSAKDEWFYNFDEIKHDWKTILHKLPSHEANRLRQDD
jgi:hypothetical protein